MNTEKRVELIIEHDFIKNSHIDAQDRSVKITFEETGVFIIGTYYYIISCNSVHLNEELNDMLEANYIEPYDIVLALEARNEKISITLTEDALPDFTNLVKRVDISVNSELYDFTDEHFNTAISTINRNEENYSVLIEVNNYERSAEKDNDPLSPEQTVHLDTLEKIINKASSNNYDEIEMYRV